MRVFGTLTHHEMRAIGYMVRKAVEFNGGELIGYAKCHQPCKFGRGALYSFTHEYERLGAMSQAEVAEFDKLYLSERTDRPFPPERYRAIKKWYPRINA